MARLAARSHLGRFRIEVIPNGLDLNRYHDSEPIRARRALELPTEPHLFLAVAGNWKNPHKGGNLLPALASGLRAMDQARLVVVGNLPAALADSLKQAGAIVAGTLQDPDALRKMYSACDATLLLSRNENFPYVVSESLACGCPVIARAIGGVPEMVEQELSGLLLAPAAGPADFLRAAQSLIQRPVEHRQALRQAARRRAERRFDLSHMLAAYDKLYHQLACSRQGGRRARAAA
jgi:glycosyltransferase involved in cell wall biosynthesis